MLPDREQLSAAMRAAPDGDIWILYSRAVLAEMPEVSDSLRDVLTSLEDRTVYTGRDRQTIVIRIPPGDPLRQ